MLNQIRAISILIFQKRTRVKSSPSLFSLNLSVENRGLSHTLFNREGSICA